MKYFLTALATLLILALLAFAFPYTGLYNVAATDGHSTLTEWFLHTTSEHSIRARAAEDSVLPDLTDSTRVARGAVSFDQMCRTCHGAPGVERSVTGQGMVPEPPRLSEDAEEWSPEEVHWILAHGIKFAGMPAYGPTHDDDELWDLVAFVEQLPELTPERYAALTTPRASDSTETHSLAADGHDHVH